MKGNEDMTIVINHKTFSRAFKNFKNELIHRKAITGSPAPDVEIINLKTKELHSLRSLEKPGRPLELIFGSCT